MCPQEELCPGGDEIFSKHASRNIPSEFNNFGFRNDAEAFKNVDPGTPGNCAGLSYVYKQVASLGMFAEDGQFYNSRGLPPPGSERIKFYDQQLKQVLAGKPASFPPYQSMARFLADPDIQTSLQRVAVSAQSARGSQEIDNVKLLHQKMTKTESDTLFRKISTQTLGNRTPEISIAYLDQTRDVSVTSNQEVVIHKRQIIEKRIRPSVVDSSDRFCQLKPEDLEKISKWARKNNFVLTENMDMTGSRPGKVTWRMTDTHFRMLEKYKHQEWEKAGEGIATACRRRSPWIQKQHSLLHQSLQYDN
jgi:hypothetical protein